MNTADVEAKVSAERDRQMQLWGEQNHPDGTGPQYAKSAQFAKETCEQAFAEGVGTWLDILVEEVFEAAEEDDEEKLMVELVQVAAVAQQWHDAIARRRMARAA